MPREHANGDLPPEFSRTKWESRRRREVDPAPEYNMAFFATHRTEDGSIYLQGGCIHDVPDWMRDIITVPDIKIYDGPTEEWEGDDGEILLITMSGNGGGVGVGLQTPGVVSWGTTIPADSLALGFMRGTTFVPVAPGNIHSQTRHLTYYNPGTGYSVFPVSIYRRTSSEDPPAWP